MTATALPIDTGTHRYRLDRTWHPTLGKMAWVMLNPSTATADLDDPTIARCTAFAKAWGYGGLTVVNVFAYRATDPAELAALSMGVAVGDFNDLHIHEVIAEAAMIVVAWGTKVPKPLRPRVADLCRVIGDRPVHALITNADGSPRHPLYVKGDTIPQRWAA
jgi:hypothetical protein